MIPIELDILTQHPKGPIHLRVYNLTPHAIRVMDPDTLTLAREYPASGTVLRATMQEELLFESVFPWSEVYRVEYRGVEVDGTETPTLDPDDRWKPGDILIVSTLTADAWEKDDWKPLPGFVQVYVPDSGPTAIRDRSGKIDGVTRFIGRRVLSLNEWSTSSAAAPKKESAGDLCLRCGREKSEHCLANFSDGMIGAAVLICPTATFSTEDDGRRPYPSLDGPMTLAERSDR